MVAAVGAVRPDSQSLILDPAPSPSGLASMACVMPARCLATTSRIPSVESIIPAAYLPTRVICSCGELGYAADHEKGRR